MPVDEKVTFDRRGPVAHDAPEVIPRGVSHGAGSSPGVVRCVVRLASEPGARIMGRVIRDRPERGLPAVGCVLREAPAPGARVLGRVLREGPGRGAPAWERTTTLAA